MEWSRFAVRFVGVLMLAGSSVAQQGSSQILLPGETPLIDPLEGNHTCDEALELVAGVYENLAVTAWAPDFFLVKAQPESTLRIDLNLRQGSHDFTIEVKPSCDEVATITQSNMYGIVPIEVENQSEEEQVYVLRLYRDVGYIGVSHPAEFDLRISESATDDPYPSLCVGDASVADCPCWNFTSGTGGCANSNDEGALLVVGGSQYEELGGLTVAAHRLPSGTPALLISSLLTEEVTPIPYADGLLCYTGPGLIRHEARVASAGGTCDWSESYDPQHLRGPGVRVALQVWYRDPASFCGSGSNFSQAVALRVLPRPD